MKIELKVVLRGVFVPPSQPDLCTSALLLHCHGQSQFHGFSKSNYIQFQRDVQVLLYLLFLSNFTLNVTDLCTSALLLHCHGQSQCLFSFENQITSSFYSFVTVSLNFFSVLKIKSHPVERAMQVFTHLLIYSSFTLNFTVLLH